MSNIRQGDLVWHDGSIGRVWVTAGQLCLPPTTTVLVGEQWTMWSDLLALVVFPGGSKWLYFDELRPPF